MPRLCAFCGSSGPLSREHVFGQWVSKIGLDSRPVGHRAGPLNRIPRDMGIQPPYRQTVKNICAQCNNGWMSKLEVTAQRVLTPLLLGETGTIAVEDQPAIAMWGQKTALTSMLLSSEEERQGGYGLPESEYRALYENRDSIQPLPATRAWVGRYEGEPGFWGVRVTPLTIQITGTPQLELPVAYAATIVLGQLALQLVRFTTPTFRMDVRSILEMSQLWPSENPVVWPTGDPCTTASFRRFADGEMLHTGIPNVQLAAWRPARHLQESTIKNGHIEMQAPCGEHSLRFPAALVAEAMAGRYYAFLVACDCPQAYLLQTQEKSTNVKAVGGAPEITEMYEALEGDELLYEDEVGSFFCKRIPPEHRVEAQGFELTL